MEASIAAWTRQLQITLYPWQIAAIAAFLESDELHLTVARSNGKSWLSALIACGHIDPRSPFRIPNCRGQIVSTSHKQASVIFGYMRDILKPDRGEWRVRNSNSEMSLLHRGTDAEIRCLTTRVESALGLPTNLVIADEIGAWPDSRLLNILRSSAGKVEPARMLCVSTKPADESHFWSRLLKADGAAGIRVIDHSNPLDANPFSLDSWKRGNPSWKHSKALRKAVAREARLAKQDPELLQTFRCYRLNCGTSDQQIENLILSPETWTSLERAQINANPPYLLGVDLGSGSAMSAAAAYFTGSDELDVFALWGQLDPESRDRQLGSRGLYAKMRDRGEIIQAKTRVPKPAELLNEALRRWNGAPLAVICDRWRLGELEDAAAEVGLNCQIIQRGQGYFHGGEDLRLFRSAAIEGRFTAKRSLLLNHSLSGARSISDPSGNSKLAKNRQGGRRSRHVDDSLAAAILAVAEAERRRSQPTARITIFEPRRIEI